MALSKPRVQFAHRRTVRLLVDADVTDIDALKIAQSLLLYADDIQGIVPLFGGKCFDINLASPEAAAKLAQEGIDYEQVHKPLRLLGKQSIQVSVFVSVEFPDADLLNLLATLAKLNPKTCDTFASQSQVSHTSKMACVWLSSLTSTVTFQNGLVIPGLEIGFKYSGQPVTCHRCHSTNHVVKHCPKRRRPIVGGGDENNPPPQLTTLIPQRIKLKTRGMSLRRAWMSTPPQSFFPPTRLSDVRSSGNWDQLRRTRGTYSPAGSYYHPDGPGSSSPASH